jgi:hypothetical protein
VCWAWLGLPARRWCGCVVCALIEGSAFGLLLGGLVGVCTVCSPVQIAVKNWREHTVDNDECVCVCVCANAKAQGRNCATHPSTSAFYLRDWTALFFDRTALASLGAKFWCTTLFLVSMRNVAGNSVALTCIEIEIDRSSERTVSIASVTSSSSRIYDTQGGCVASRQFAGLKCICGVTCQARHLVG